MKQTFSKGIRDGLPICIGYFFVSFGFGILAVKSGFTAWAAALISATNVTSAGQTAGVTIIAAGGTLVEIMLTQLVINCRYSLMALSLTQNLSNEFTWYHRLLVAFGITDEIFGVAATQKAPIRPIYMYGMIFISFIGWVSGTLLGGLSGELFPVRITASFGILLYGMFIALVFPIVRDSIKNLILILLSAGISCIIYYFIPVITSGFSIIISAVLSAAVMALIVPIKDTEEVAHE